MAAKLMNRSKIDRELTALLWLYLSLHGSKPLPVIARDFIAENREQFREFLASQPGLLQGWVNCFGEP